jgi:DNA-binding MarR family transcriptional regulator
MACRRGIVELVDDPLDGRARKVRFTGKGMRMVGSASRVSRSIETQLERQLGPRDLAALRRILAKAW